AKSEYRPALEAYTAAVALDPSVISDERVRANLALMIDDDGPVLVDAALLLDLEQEPTCKARRDAVTRLRALGDPRAVAPLRAALDRPGFVKKGRRKQ